MNKLGFVFFLILGIFFGFLLVIGVLYMIDGSQEMFPTEEQDESARIFATVIMVVSLPSTIFCLFKAAKCLKK